MIHSSRHKHLNCCGVTDNIERGLMDNSPDIPANTKKSRRGKKGWKFTPSIKELIALLCLGSCGLLFFFDWADKDWTNQRLASEGQLTTGEIIAMDTSRSTRNGVTWETYHIRYSYTVDNVNY